MALNPEEIPGLEQKIRDTIRNLTLDSTRLKAGLRVLMTTPIETFETISSAAVQQELGPFKEMLAKPESLAPLSFGTLGAEPIIGYVKRYTLENLDLLDKRTTILPNAATVVKGIKEGERLKSVVHISAVRNVVKAAHFVDAVRIAFKAEGLPPEELDEAVKRATEALEYLHQAVIDGDYLTFDENLEIPGVDVNLPNPDGLSLLHVAARERQVDMTKRLLKLPNIRVNIVSNNGWTPLHIAARLGYADIVEELLKAPDIDVNVVNSDGWTPLHWAAWHGFTDVVILLLTNPKLNVNPKDRILTTPLHLAARNGQADIINLLLSRPDVSVNELDNDSRTPLHLAVFFGHAEATGALIYAPGLDMNIPDIDGATPLHLAARNGRKDLVLLLLTNPNVRLDQLDHNEMTAADWAKRNEYPELARMLSPKKNNGFLSKIKGFFSQLLSIYKK